ncbi:MAG: dienelactone hydrolase family protein [Acidobacteriota bacterium]
MSWRIVLPLSAFLATAGGAFSLSGSPVLEAGGRISISLGDGAVETLVVTAKGDGPPPALLVGLHGYGMEAAQIATLVDIEPSFDHVYLAPEGFHRLEDGSRAWFPIGFDGREPVVNRDDFERFADRLDRYVEAAAARVGARTVYLIGYSQGGAAAINLAATRPGLADAFVGLAGSVLPSVLGSASTVSSRLFVGHGTRDPVVPHALIIDGVERLRQRGVDVTFREYDIPHVVGAAERRDVAAWLDQVHAVRRR